MKLICIRLICLCSFPVYWDVVFFFVSYKFSLPMRRTRSIDFPANSMERSSAAAAAAAAATSVPREPDGVVMHLLLQPSTLLGSDTVFSILAIEVNGDALQMG